MKSYLIDELSGRDVRKITAFLMEHAAPSGMDGLFWVTLPDDILSEVQYEHQECRPHVIAVECGGDWVRFELLVRNRNKINCPCSGYTTREQTRFVLNFADSMIEKLAVRT